jgi:hypothetical protein
MGEDSVSNLNIWDSVKAVDQKHLKAANVGGNKCISVNGLEMVRLITEAIGPIGKSWKYNVKWERFDNEKPMVNPSNNEPVICDGAAVWEQSHSAMIEFSVNHGDEWHSFEQMGHTPYRYGSGGTTYNGQVKPFKIVVDKEYGKKTITDGLKKCLSLLGVAADVYSGDLDDYNYAQQAQDVIEIKKADQSAEAQIEMVAEIKKRTEAAIKFIEESSTIDMAKRTIRPVIAWLSNRQSSANPATSKPATHALSLIDKAMSEANAKLNPEQELPK